MRIFLDTADTDLIEKYFLQLEKRAQELVDIMKTPNNAREVDK